MKNKNRVTSDAYDERWLASAWGSKANDQLLSAETLRVRPRLQRALELACLAPGQTLLDIACGRGEMPSFAAEHGVSSVGIDYSAASLGFARELRQARQGHIKSTGAMHLVCADASRLPFADESFDRITMLDIIEHLVPEQLEAMFCEVNRLLCPGGYAVLHTLPNRWVYDITFPVLHRLIPKLPRDPRGPFERDIHVNEQDLPKLHRMLKRCNLRHSLWLEQHMPAQARWNRSQDQYGDNRDKLYPALAGPLGSLLEFMSLTPLKLLLSNDIFGIVWKAPFPPHNVKRPFALTERITCAMAGGNY